MDKSYHSSRLPGFVTITEAAEKLGKTVGQINGMIARGEFGHVYYVITHERKIVYLIPEGRVL